jgi:hypothetical protein
MSEEQMVELVQAFLRDGGIDDEIVAAGQFSPRGHTGSAFAGGLIGSAIGGELGGIGDAVGTAGGFVAGHKVHDAASDLPAEMLVGVSDTMVYGCAAATRRSEPTALVFRVPRAGLTAKTHARVNVRVLELIEEGSGSRIELEGNRLPVTHSKDVIHVLTS